MKRYTVAKEFYGFKVGDEVTARQLQSTVPDDLVRKGYLTPITAQSQAKPPAPPAPETPTSQ